MWGRTGRQRFKGKRKGESCAVDNSSNTVDSMGAWLHDRLYDEWFHSHSGRNCYCGCAGQDNFRPTGAMMPRVSGKEHL